MQGPLAGLLLLQEFPILLHFSAFCTKLHKEVDVLKAKSRRELFLQYLKPSKPNILIPAKGFHADMECMLELSAYVSPMSLAALFPG
jgi:hypothetical protein